jgi:hypothetical protein
MFSKILSLALGAMVLFGCCIHRVRVDKFDRMTLEQQVAAYEEA